MHIPTVTILDFLDFPITLYTVTDKRQNLGKVIIFISNNNDKLANSCISLSDTFVTQSEKKALIIKTY